MNARRVRPWPDLEGVRLRHISINRGNGRRLSLIAQDGGMACMMIMLVGTIRYGRYGMLYTVCR